MSELPINQIVTGDCLEVLRDWPDKSVDLVVTDPPYGHNNNDDDLIARWEVALGISKEAAATRPIANDGPEANELFRLVLTQLRRILKPGCCCCCCCGGGGGPDPQFARWSLWMNEVFSFKQMVVWDKGPMGMGWHYRRSYETVLIGEVPGAACKWYGGNDTENIIRPGDYGIRKIIPNSKQHPTQKPLELAMHFIRIHSEPQDVVLDPFCGHGWTCIAAKMLGRRFIGIDIWPAYVEIARERLRAVDTGVPVKEARAGQMPLFNEDSVKDVS
jgi:site-specific DNA-methyltransferase (adenine-specific)